MKHPAEALCPVVTVWIFEVAKLVFSKRTLIGLTVVEEA
jgi:hypothetical protein